MEAFPSPTNGGMSPTDASSQKAPLWKLFLNNSKNVNGKQTIHAGLTIPPIGAPSPLRNDRMMKSPTEGFVSPTSSTTLPPLRSLGSPDLSDMTANHGVSNRLASLSDLKALITPTHATDTANHMNHHLSFGSHTPPASSNLCDSSRFGVSHSSSQLMGVNQVRNRLPLVGTGTSTPAHNSLLLVESTPSHLVHHHMQSTMGPSTLSSGSSRMNFSSPASHGCDILEETPMNSSNGNGNPSMTSLSHIFNHSNAFSVSPTAIMAHGVRSLPSPIGQPRLATNHAAALLSASVHHHTTSSVEVPSSNTPRVLSAFEDALLTNNCQNHQTASNSGGEGEKSPTGSAVSANGNSSTNNMISSSASNGGSHLENGISGLTAAASPTSIATQKYLASFQPHLHTQHNNSNGHNHMHSQSEAPVSASFAAGKAYVGNLMNMSNSSNNAASDDYLAYTQNMHQQQNIMNHNHHYNTQHYETHYHQNYNNTAQTSGSRRRVNQVYNHHQQHSVDSDVNSSTLPSNNTNSSLHPSLTSQSRPYYQSNVSPQLQGPLSQHHMGASSAPTPPPGRRPPPRRAAAIAALRSSSNHPSTANDGNSLVMNVDDSMANFGDDLNVQQQQQQSFTHHRSLRTSTRMIKAVGGGAAAAFQNFQQQHKHSNDAGRSDDSEVYDASHQTVHSYDDLPSSGGINNRRGRARESAVIAAESLVPRRLLPYRRGIHMRLGEVGRRTLKSLVQNKMHGDVELRNWVRIKYGRVKSLTVVQLLAVAQHANLWEAAVALAEQFASTKGADILIAGQGEGVLDAQMHEYVLTGTMPMGQSNGADGMNATDEDGGEEGGCTDEFEEEEDDSIKHEDQQQHVDSQVHEEGVAIEKQQPAEEVQDLNGEVKQELSQNAPSKSEIVLSDDHARGLKESSSANFKAEPFSASNSSHSLSSSTWVVSGVSPSAVAAPFASSYVSSSPPSSHNNNTSASPSMTSKNHQSASATVVAGAMLPQQQTVAFSSSPKQFSSSSVVVAVASDVKPAPPCSSTPPTTSNSSPPSASVIATGAVMSVTPSLPPSHALHSQNIRKSSSTNTFPTSSTGQLCSPQPAPAVVSSTVPAVSQNSLPAPPAILIDAGAARSFLSSAYPTPIHPTTSLSLPSFTALHVAQPPAFLATPQQQQTINAAHSESQQSTSQQAKTFVGTPVVAPAVGTGLPQPPTHLMGNSTTFVSHELLQQHQQQPQFYNTRHFQNPTIGEF
eukprot:GDKJ01029929.1.p1 GENE.GDKJ01029929.1~~GDKJ01029929.1.p1  ORF type:complete len:1233 (+),score=396.57 GDKJ01029929.1:128-3826(+)